MGPHVCSEHHQNRTRLLKACTVLDLSSTKVAHAAVLALEFCHLEFFAAAVRYGRRVWALGDWTTWVGYEPWLVASTLCYSQYIIS